MIDALKKISSFEFNSTPIINPLWGFGSTLSKVAKWGFWTLTLLAVAASGLATENKNGLCGKEILPLREPLQAFPENFEYYVHPGEMMTKWGAHSCMLLNGPVDLDRCTELAVYAELHLETSQPGRLQRMIEEDVERRIHTEVDGEEIHLGEDPKQLLNHQKALRYVEKNVLKNPAFFQQSAEQILKTIRTTHQLLAAGTREMFGQAGGEFRTENTFIRRLGFDEQYENLGRGKKQKFVTILQKNTWSIKDQEFLRQLGLFIPVLGRENIEKAMMELAQTIQMQGPLILTGEVNPIEFAAFVHNEIARIHPFYPDGNGRLARLWMNTLLGIGGIKPIHFPTDEAYTEAVEGGAEAFAEYLRSLIHPVRSLSS